MPDRFGPRARLALITAPEARDPELLAKLDAVAGVLRDGYMIWSDRALDG